MVQFLTFGASYKENIKTAEDGGWCGGWCDRSHHQSLPVVFVRSLGLAANYAVESVPLPFIQERSHCGV